MAIESLVKYCTIGKGRLWQRWTFLVLQILVCLVRWNFEVLKTLLRALAEEKLT
jgi:hypothetical protein